MVKRWSVLFVLLSCILLNGCALMPSPAVNQTTQVYKLYIPLSTYPVRFGKGASGAQTCNDLALLRATWTYNWGPHPLECPGIFSLPMINTLDNACPIIGFGNPILLWNEPSNAPLWGGAPPSVEQAITLTHRYTEECFPNRTFATPATYNTYVSQDWLDAWWNGYTARYGKPPRVITLATHCYFGYEVLCENYLTDNINWAHARGLNVLVTEWAIIFPRGTDPREHSLPEADILWHWMQRQPSIIGEAWFTTRMRGDEPWHVPTLAPTGLIDIDTGQLTDIGVWYSQQ